MICLGINNEDRMKIDVTLEEFNRICLEQFNQYSLLWRPIDISTTATPCGIDPKFWNIL